MVNKLLVSKDYNDVYHASTSTKKLLKTCAYDNRITYYGYKLSKKFDSNVDLYYAGFSVIVDKNNHVTIAVTKE